MSRYGTLDAENGLIGKKEYTYAREGMHMEKDIIIRIDLETLVI